MKVTVSASKIQGEVQAIASKSVAHRYLIAAALADKDVFVGCHSVSEDIMATVGCLQAMGAKIKRRENGFIVSPIDKSGIDGNLRQLPCNESGSTIRFLIPVVAALGINGEFLKKGSLIQRPLKPLDDEMAKKGAPLLEKEGGVVAVQGKLEAGIYELPGNVSSQYITGLLFALPLLDKDSEIRITTALQSEDYVKITLDTLKAFSISIKYENNCFYIPGKQVYTVSSEPMVEGDWSNAAFFMTGAAIGKSEITYTNLSKESLQGDKAVVEILKNMGAHIYVTGDAYNVSGDNLKATEIDAKPIPDLVPILALAAAVAEGETVIFNAERLRIKESDRLKTVYETLHTLGADIEEKEDGLIIRGKERLKGGTVSSFNDHRIAMMAAIASIVCDGEVTILQAESVNKSYPGFYEDFKKLGGQVRIDEE